MKLQQAWSRQRVAAVECNAEWDAAARTWHDLQALRPRLTETARRLWAVARASVLSDLRWRIDELIRKLQDLRP
jgi:hypothetical protein